MVQQTETALNNDSFITARQSSQASRSSMATSDTTLRQYTESDQLNDQTNPLRCFFNALTRKKPLDCRTDTNLNRCLNLVQLTALGVGSTLGLGLYVLAGQVASKKAGPGVVISFALAALASAFSALCYAEFAGRVPRAGSAYAYSYITVGEFVAFIIGWNLILEYVIGASSVARGFSEYLHLIIGTLQPSSGTVTLTTSTMSNFTRVAIVTGNMTETQIGWQDSVINYVVKYFDWPSVAIIAVLTVFILMGVKDSTNVTLFFTTINVFVVIVVVISSIKYLNWHNWSLSKNEVPAGSGEGGFLPYGWSGVLAGSATCFFGFIGFDTIASSAEEAKNPRRNVPLSIILSLLISFVAYMAVAIVQTLLWPYHAQNSVTILPYIFTQLNMPITYWVVLSGAIAGLTSSQLGGMYPLPRILYSMAQDKLIYGFLAHVNRRLKLPVRATIVGSIFVAILACLLDIQDLADMVSIGTLAAYSLVSLSVLILRYEDRSDAIDDSTHLSSRLSFSDILAANGNHQVKQSDDSHDRTLDTNPDPLTEQSKPQRLPLTANPSIPIRTNGSRPLVGQLSVGFNSWFKTPEMGVIDVPESPNNSIKPKSKRKSLLSLLISWKSGDVIDHNGGPDKESSKLSKILISLIVLFTILFDLVVLCFTSITTSSDLSNHLASKEVGNTNEHVIVKAVRSVSNFAEPEMVVICMGCIVLVILATLVLMLSRLPTSKLSRSDAFQVPFVPLIPTLSILVNTLLMLNLSFLTWVRFTVWMSFGLFIYFTYGLWNSQGYMLHTTN